ncbi:MAG: tetratricopeptide repeat protein [Rhodomicrobium sp.]
MHAPLPIAYKAFLSYSHADTASAKWLHKRLESFPLSGLAGRETALGPAPKSLRPIFRDREDFSAGHSLTDQTIASLDASAALIVLCSPASASSRYVNEEIRLFKSRHPVRPVIPLIVNGKPGGAANECFAPALRFELDAEGTVTDRPLHILAADIRDAGDGRELALAKVVAALIGVPSDEVFRRAERERRRQTRLRAAIAATILLLAGAGGYLGWRSYTQQQTLTDIEALVNQYAPIGSAEAAQPGARERLRSAFESIAKGTATDPRYARALDLIKAGKPREAEPLLRESAEEEEAAGLKRIKQAAEKYRNLGAIAGYADLKRAREYFAKAAQLDPENIPGMELLGSMEKEAGNLSEAARAFKRVLSTGQIGRDDEDLYNARLGMGDILVQRGDLAEALESYREASAEANRLAKANPGNAFWQRNVSLSYERVGDVFRARGNLQDALKSFRESLAIAEGFASAHPNDAGWQRDLSVSYVHVGDVLVAQGNLQEALKSFREGLAIANRLAKSEPNSAIWQRDLSVLHERVGDVLVEEGNLADAFENYRDGLGIAERLAKSDPSNASWQRDLWVAYEKVGDVLRAQGSLPEALNSYNNGLGIAARLANADPANTLWLRDLSASYLGVGGVLRTQGNLAEALKSFRDSVAVLERLAKSDPSNVDWQRDLSVAYEKVGDVLWAQGSLPEALAGYRDSLAIRDRLAKADPSNAGWQRDLSVSYNKVGDVLVDQGNLPDALKAYRDSLAVAERLAGLYPGNYGWQADLTTIHHNLGQLHLRMGDKAEARRMFERGRALLVPLTEKPGHQRWIGYLKRIQDSIAALDRQEAKEAIEAAFEAGDFAKAAEAQAKLAEAVERGESERVGKLGSAAASELSNLSWYRLFARYFKGALEASDRAIAIEPERILHATNKAHALMFLGRAEEARALYLRYKGQATDKGGKLWEAAILEDFQEFEKRGLTHPQMAEIRRLLAPAAPPQ